MLSKSKGQILRISAVFTVLFKMNEPMSSVLDISDVAVTAAINFVSLACNHAFYLTSRMSLGEEIECMVVEETAEDEDALPDKEKDLKTHILLLPGEHLHVTPLLKKKKFRGYAPDKGTVVKAMEELEEEDLGTLRSERGPGSYVVRIVTLYNIH